MAKTNENVTQPAEDDPEESTRAMDPEIRVMGQMVRIVEKIDEPARGRVIEWLRARYPFQYCGLTLPGRDKE